MMARKPSADEERVFADPLPKPEVSQSETEDEAFQQELCTRRDTALLLSPELGAWFSVELPARLED